MKYAVSVVALLVFCLSSALAADPMDRGRKTPSTKSVETPASAKAAMNAAPQEAMKNSVTVPVDGDYRVQPRDTLTVAVFQEPELSQRVRVSQQGTINYPLLGVLRVQGMTVSEVEKKLTAELAKDYLVNPRVTVTAETYTVPKRIILLGQVKAPGTYELPDLETYTLMQAIGRAGGFTDVAAFDRVTIIRTDKGKEQILKVNVSAIIKSGDKSKDIELKPGDIVSVPETFF